MVAFDAVGPAGGAGIAFTTSPGTWTHVNSGNGIIVGITILSGTTDPVTAVTYGGVALTKIVAVLPAGGISVWGLVGATCPTGSNTVSVTVTDPANNHNAGSISFSAGASFGTPGTVTDTVGSTSKAATVPGTTAGGLIVSCASHGKNGGTWGFTGGTVRWTHDNSSNTGSDNGAGATIASAGGSQVVTWTNTLSDNWAIAAVEVLPAGGGGGGAPSGSAPATPPGLLSPMNFQHLQFNTGQLGTVSVTPVALSDSGSGADAFTVTGTVTPADSGTGADTLTVTAAAALADSGSGADSFTVSVPAVLGDSGSAADAFTASVPVAVGDSGSGTDAFAMSVTTGPFSGTTAVDLGNGSGAWVNPSNALADDGSVATWTVP